VSFSSLRIGASALSVAQRAMETTSHNVANAGVDGYTRQRVELTAARPTPGTAGSRGDGMRGAGVTIVAISRLRDQLADIAYRSEAATAGETTARATVLDRMQSGLGPVTGGAPAALSQFYAAWDQLALTPTDPAARAGVMNAGAAVARALREGREQFAEVTGDVSLRVAGAVDEVNNLTTQIATLNRVVLDAVTAGQAPNDLLDQRDRALDRLASLTGATFRIGDNQVADVFLGSRSLVRGPQAVPLAAYQAGGRPDVGFADDVAAGNPLPAAVKGEIGGYVEVTNTTIPSLLAGLDAVAAGLIGAVNARHGAGYGLDGSTGTPFFAGSTAADIELSPGLTTDKVAAGATAARNDGNNALALAALRSDPGAVTNTDGSTSSVGDALRAFAGRLGAAAAGAFQAAEASVASAESAAKNRSAASGVNLDEEMVDLLKYQHGYEAAARVVSIADGMLDTLINRMGAGR
jgi:flagellar hook-associated protein 1 FlgK